MSLKYSIEKLDFYYFLRQITIGVGDILLSNESNGYGGGGVKTVVYADVLIVVNIIVNYFLLRAAAAIISFDFKTVRFLAASALGGAFSLIIFVEELSPVLLTGVKFAFMLVMTVTAFGFVSLKRFVKCCAAFFAANLAFAGLMLAGCTFIFPNSVIYKNSVVYFDMDILTLTVAAVASYAVLSGISRAVRNRTPPQSVYKIRISKDGQAVEGKALFDTGNSLCDSFSGRPVVIAERSFIEALAPKGTAFEPTAMHGFRLIPYTSLGGSGALPAFPADSIEITERSGVRKIENIYIAVTEKKIIHGGYAVLIGSPLFE